MELPFLAHWDRRVPSQNSDASPHSHLRVALGRVETSLLPVSAIVRGLQACTGQHPLVVCIIVRQCMLTQSIASFTEGSSFWIHI